MARYNQTSLVMKALSTSITLILLLLATTVINAEENQLATSTNGGRTMYVNDELWITVRTEPDTSAEKVAVIRSGTRMTVLSYNEGDDFARVTTENGHKGWVLYRYLTDEPVASLRLAEAETEINRLREANSRASGSLNSLKSETRDADKRIQELEQTNSSLSKELEDLRAISSDAVSTYQKNKTLELDLDKQKTIKESLEHSNQGLRTRLLIFTTGAAIIGLLVGLYIGTIPLRRDKRWRSLS